MLHELVNYARNHGIEAEPGFRPKSARWAVVCSAKGDYLGVVELGNAGAKKNRGKEFSKAPNLTQPEMVGATPKSHFLIESAEVVAGVARMARKRRLLRNGRTLSVCWKAHRRRCPNLARLLRFCTTASASPR